MTKLKSNHIPFAKKENQKVVRRQTLIRTPTATCIMMSLAKIK
jgi:hypothetical protein